MKSLIRLHQLLLILAILSGCYAPDLRDCTVTCSGAKDCASGQVCGADGYCAAEDVAGSCGNAVDAAVDAVPSVMLRVTVDGDGHVDVVGGGSCSDCVMQVPKNAQLVVKAIAERIDHPFDRWTSLTCAGQTATCMFTVSGPTTVTAKFR
jgi:hypothetical protein